MRITVVINIATPYTTPVFREVASRDGVDLKVIYESPTEPGRHWRPEPNGYPHEVLRTVSLDLRWLAEESLVHLPVRPLRRIATGAPDVVIGAGAGVWSSPATIAAWFGRQRGRWRFVPWWGSFARAHPSLPRRLADPWVRAFIRTSDAWLASGSRSREYVLGLGAHEAATFVSPLVAAPMRPATFEAANRPSARFLFVGRVIELKGVADLVEAFSRLAHGELFVAGDGPLLPLVRDAAERDSRIRLLGHLDQQELERVYADVDVLVLPSRREVWGLVVNEAMAYGLPVIVSDAAGATDDLVTDGVTGRIFPAGNVDALTAAMEEVGAWDETQRERCARVARNRLSEWSIEAAADGLIAAARAALGDAA